MELTLLICASAIFCGLMAVAKAINDFADKMFEPHIECKHDYELKINTDGKDN